jgi:hypothetical protein
MEALHGLLAEHFSSLLTNGVKALDKDGNEVVLPPRAADLNVIRQFLKDNGIDAQKSGDPAGADPFTNSSAESLPFLDADERPDAE